MDIYREDSVSALNAFLFSDVHTEGKRRSILSSLPLYTMEENYLKKFLEKHSLSEADKQNIMSYAEQQRNIAGQILRNNIIEDEIPYITKEEFENYPMSLPLSGMFYENDILYTYKDYLEHLKQSLKYAEKHPNYILSRHLHILSATCR